MSGKKLDEIQIGEHVSVKKTIASQDVIDFARVTGDLNPIHIDDLAASKSIFKKRVIHGALINALFSGVLGMRLPGNDCIYLKQETKFVKPAFIDDTIEARVEVLEIDYERKRVVLKTEAINQHNELVAVGTATVLVNK